MQRKYGKLIIATLTIGVLLIGVTGLALADNFFFVGSTNTVTQVNYPTTTATVVTTSTGTVTVTGTPVETLTTVTVPGSQTYTTTITQTTGAITTTTATADEDFYSPFAMYYTATTNNPFYEQLSPVVTTATDGTAFSESGGSMSITTSASPPPYYDLGFYYVFQNLKSGTIDAFNTYSITATGTAGPTISGGFATNLWINPQDWTWTPEGVGQDSFTSLGADGAYGLGSGALSISGDTGTETVSSSSSFYITAAAAGSCLHSVIGTTVTVATILSDCPSSTPFALWYGIVGPSAASTTASASISSIYSAPYP